MNKPHWLVLQVLWPTFFLILNCNNTKAQTHFEVSSGTPYEEDFESGALNTTYWSYTSETDGTVKVTTANSPYEGAYHLTMDKSGASGVKTQNEAWLFLDLTTAIVASDSIILDFYWQDYGDETDSGIDGIFLSNDAGSTFFMIKELFGHITEDDKWKRFRYNLRELARNVSLSLTDKMVIKFQQRDDSSIGADGFAFDKITVSVGSVSRATLPYSTDFEAGVLDDYWTVSIDTSRARCQVTSNYQPQSGSYGLILDAGVFDSSDANSAALLFLDLQSQGDDNKDVQFEFHYKDFGEEDSNEDGIFFSDDGGLTFVKVIDISADHVTDDTWQHMQIDLDDLASQHGLNMNSQFVIKFQQKDNNNIDTSDLLNSDGLAFDNISIFEAEIVKATLPFEEKFENVRLRSEWSFRSTDELSDSRGRIQITEAHGSVSGSYALVMNASDFKISNKNVTNELFLHLDLTAQTLGTDHVELEFYWKDQGERSDAEDGIWVSDDGGATFHKIMEFGSATEEDDTWFHERLFIDSLMLRADPSLTYSGDFIIKFQQHDDSWNDGIILEDITIEASSSSVTPSTLPYGTSFESGTLDASWYTTSDDVLGRVRVRAQETPATGSYHLLMDVASSSSPDEVTSEAWLFLDMSSETEGVFMTCQWQDFGDETDASFDGIFLSDDNGANFYEVYSFSGSTVGYQSVFVDIDAEVNSNADLDYTEDFVIKFQQKDNLPIINDGFGFDDVFVANNGACWNGSVSSSWDDPANWADGKVPDACSCVIIDPSKCAFTNSPVISSDVTVGVMEIRSGGVLTINSSTTVTVMENWVNDGGTVTVDGTVKFAGTNGQEIFGTTTFANLEIDNTSEEGLVLTSPVNVSNVLTLTNGKIHTTNTNILTIEDDAIISGCDSDKYIVGSLAKEGDDDFEFCIGLDEVGRNNLTKIGISDLDISTTFTAQSFNYKYSDTKNFEAGGSMMRVSGLEYWDLHTDDSGSDVLITLFWEDSDVSEINDVTSLTIGHYDTSNSYWEDLGQGSSTIDGTGGSITSNVSLSNFSAITFGTTNDSQNSLPVTLTSFQGDKSGKEVRLTWKTASEINNDYFAIERSFDTKYWPTVGKVSGQGTTNIPSTYSFSDFPYSSVEHGAIYYRLKQVDFDGSYTFSHTVSIQNTKVSPILSVYPNPTSTYLKVEYIATAQETTSIELYSIHGKMVYTSRISEVTSGSSSHQIDLAEISTGKGTYILKTIIAGEVLVNRILIQ